VTAAALLREATAAGIELRLVDGSVKVRGTPAPELRAALREVLPEVAAILSGDVCRCCGAPLPSRSSLGVLVVFGDGTAECMACADREVGRLMTAGRRAVESADALGDPAELMLQHGSLS
jgi:hypothetical protein